MTFPERVFFYLFQTGLLVGKTFALHIVIIFGITVLRLIFRRTWYILIGNCLLLPVCAGSCCRVADSLKSSHSSVVGTSPSSASSGCTFRYGSASERIPVQCTVRTYCLPDHLPSAHPQLHRSQVPDHLPVQIR